MYKSEKYELKKATPQSAGYDLRSLEKISLNPGINRVKTGISMQIPEGYYGQIFSRSGMASKGILAEGGVIDSDYRGEVGVIINNVSGNTVEIDEGTRIAQLVIIKIWDFELEKTTEDFTETVRGTGGFGSTGTN